jgi:hypothetical protein
MTADSAQFAVRTVASDDLDLAHASKNGDVAADAHGVGALGDWSAQWHGNILRVVCGVISVVLVLWAIFDHLGWG